MKEGTQGQGGEGIREQGREEMRNRGRYDDILHLPHPVSGRHPQMPLSDRAAQFMPFAALTGHEDAVRETARLTVSRVELDEGQRENLDRRLSLLLQAMREHPGLEPEIAVTYFKPDEKKDGGAYVSVEGQVKKVDGYRRMIVFRDGTALPMDEIVGMAGDVFADLAEY